MDEFIKQLVLDLPNFAGLVLVVLYLARRLDRMQQMQDRLLERCFEDERLVPTEKPWDDPPVG